MKARHIRKLRKRLQEYQTYIVIPATSMGCFDKKYSYIVKSGGFIHAIERYMKYYYRKNKEKSPYYSVIYDEIRASLSVICVIDEKGYKRYYI